MDEGDTAFDGHFGSAPRSREAYDPIVENEFKSARDEPLSTFSIDVDTASYANVRRMLSAGRLPPPDAVRIEELLNYFPYDYPEPRGVDPFAVHVDVAGAPWAPTHRLVRIGLKGREVSYQERQASNLVFLLDVSGSMNSANKLPLLVQSLSMLIQELDERDRVAIVVYAGASGLVLPSTSASNKSVILDALLHLSAGGSTNGGAGIELAYTIAAQQFLQGGINRVILATDGDFNVGVSDRGSLTRLIEAKAKSGVFLSVLGFGTGNLKDSQMEQLADKGNGNYAYIDGLLEARKVLVEQMGGTLVTIAKDVKIQVEFNPAEVQAWRLIGYENRVLAHQDFNDDRKDAGEIGSGHTVTALYEVVPSGVAWNAAGVDPLRYGPESVASGEAGAAPPVAGGDGELLFVKLRYKQPDGDTSLLLEQPVRDTGLGLEAADADLRFAAAVAAFGMQLRGSPHLGDFTWDGILELARQGLGPDRGGYRSEFVRLIGVAMGLQGSRGR